MTTTATVKMANGSRSVAFILIILRGCIRVATTPNRQHIAAHSYTVSLVDVPSYKNTLISIPPIHTHKHKYNARDHKNILRLMGVPPNTKCVPLRKWAFICNGLCIVMYEFFFSFLDPSLYEATTAKRKNVKKNLSVETSFRPVHCFRSLHDFRFLFLRKVFLHIFFSGRKTIL